MPRPYDTPTDLLHALATSDPTRPRLTWYDEAPGPTQGERIELSGRVLATWAAKAANLLEEEFEVGPGSVVAIELPVHWRAAYWLLAVWSVGAEAVVGAQGQRGADLLVTADPPGAGGRVVAVSEPALVRGWAGMPLGPGVIDEARELASYADVFGPSAEPAPEAVALTTAERSWTYEELVPAARAAAAAERLESGARVMTSLGAEQVVRAWLAPWVLDGSLVLVRADESRADQARPDQARPDQARLEQIATAERVTDRL